MTSPFVPPSGPFTVGAGAESALFPFPETEEMVLVVCTAAASSGILLSTGGDGVLLSTAPIEIPGPAGDQVARVAMTVDAPGAFTVRIDVRQPGSRWTVAVRNGDPGPRHYTCAVADTDADARIPWMLAPTSVKFAGEDVTTAEVVIDNVGTGPLVPFPDDLPAGFQVLAPPSGEIPPYGSATYQLEGPARTWFPTSATWTIEGGTDSVHTAVVALEAPPAPSPPPNPDPDSVMGPCSHPHCPCHDYKAPTYPPDGSCVTQFCHHAKAFHEYPL